MNNTREYNPLEHSVVQSLLKPDATHRYEVPKYVQALIFHLKKKLDTVYWNWHQESLDSRQDWQFIGRAGFEYRRYCWDDCDCGADSPVHSADCAEIVQHRDWNARRMAAISDPSEWSLMSEEAKAAKLSEIRETAQREGHDVQMGLMMMFATYGGSRVHFDRSDDWEKENPRPVCSCGAEAEWKPREFHLATCSPQLPNLKFGDVTINWYKYIGRGMSTSVAWEPSQWVRWFDTAMEAVGMDNHCMQVRHQQFRDQDAGREPFKTADRTQCADCRYCVAFGSNSRIWNRDGSCDVSGSE